MVSIKKIKVEKLLTKIFGRAKKQNKPNDYFIVGFE
jgi:hypothetical protein